MIPIELLRQFRFNEYAIFDFIAAFLGIYLLAPLLSKLFIKMRIDIPRKSWLFLTLPIGIFAHIIAGNITPMTRDFIDINGHYILKIIIIGLVIIAAKDVKIIKRVINK